MEEPRSPQRLARAFAETLAPDVAASFHKWCSTVDARAVSKEGRSEDEKKPSAEDLHERIDDLEFELECCKADSKETEKRLRALRMLLQAIDLQRFEGKNKQYLEHILQKIKNLIK